MVLGREKKIGDISIQVCYNNVIVLVIVLLLLHVKSFNFFPLNVVLVCGLYSCVVSSDVD